MEEKAGGALYKGNYEGDKMKLSFIEGVLIICIIVVVLLMIASAVQAETYTVTFYSNGEEGGNGKWGNLNAVGGTLAYGDIACSDDIPFGTRFIIDYESLELPQPEDGCFVCRDRGSAIKDNKLDIFIPERLGGVARCFELGRKVIEVVRE